MSITNKIVVTGTGRCGTSFLMQLLTNCGLNTGYSREEAETSIARIDGLNAGIEHGTLNDRTFKSEYIKNPNWLTIENFTLLKKTHHIERVLLLIRDFEAVAKSKEYMHSTTHGSYGGFSLGATDIDSQRVANALALYVFIEHISRIGVKFTIINFNKMMSSPNYLYGKLERPVKYGPFKAEYKELLDPQKIRF